jgi:hypothetical protein
MAQRQFDRRRDLTEVSGVATGRTDIYVGFGGTRFIIELKKHEGFVTETVATSYQGQATSYQATMSGWVSSGSWNWSVAPAPRRALRSACGTAPSCRKAQTLLAI